MKTISFFNEKIASVKEADSEKMNLLIRAVKAIHSASTNPTATGEELKKQRAETEALSKLIALPVGLETNGFRIGDIPCEWFKPDFAHRKDIIILYCHGGGYTCGGLGYSRILASKLAHHTGLQVVSFEYRLAPEHPAPAPIEDGLAVWDYLMKKGYGAKNIILAGDSAGGNLALELTLKLREQERILPRGLVLFSPWTDMSCSGNSYETNREKDPTITLEYVKCVRAAYAGADADFTDPALSPLFADMTNMPPTLVQVGSYEVLRDDSEKLAKKITKAGGFSRLEVYQGGWHVFQMAPVPKANRAMDSVKEFLDYILM